MTPALATDDHPFPAKLETMKGRRISRLDEGWSELSLSGGKVNEGVIDKANGLTRERRMPDAFEHLRGNVVCAEVAFDGRGAAAERTRISILAAFPELFIIFVHKGKIRFH